MTRVLIKQILKVADMDSMMISNWQTHGMVKPLTGGSGRKREYDILTAVGVCVGAELKRSPRGCAGKYIKEIVTAFENVTESWLLKQFAKGHTCFVTEHNGRPLLQGKQYDWPDVQKIYHELKAVAETR